MQSILLHIRDDLGAEGRFQAACDLARATGAHIRCVQVTAIPDMLGADVYGGGAFAPTIMAELRDTDEAIREQVEARLAREGVQWDWWRCEGDLLSGLLSSARLTDLIVATLPQGPRNNLRDPVNLVAELALHGRTPILAMPQAADRFVVSGRAVIAWDGSVEAAAALRSAVPLLKLAEAVHILTVEESDKPDFPATDAPEYLARHGIGVELHSLTRHDDPVETVLSRAIDAFAADWVVMGLYGHSRLREWMFGGVTRQMLRNTHIPLLLAH